MGRRVLAWVLVLYGIAGLALTVTGAAIGLDAATRLERLASDADGTLVAAAEATRAAAESFTNVDASLADAQESASAASSLALDASGTLRSLALAMQLNILGTRPLQPLAAEFETSAEQADALAETLGSVGGSLGDTRTDLILVGAELDTLGDRIERLRGTDETSAAPSLRLFVILLVIWLVLPAVASLVTGLAMLRRPPVVVARPGGVGDGPNPPA